jgi:hypothetical protein
VVHVVYVDDDRDGQVVIHGDDLIGLSGDPVTFVPKQVANYVMTQVDQSDGQTYDEDAQVDQTITVHLRHDTAPINDYVMRQIDYWTTNKTAAPANQAQTVILHGMKDLVTGEITWEPDGLAAVPSPDKTGYTVDVNVVPAVALDKPTADWRVDVTYTPEPQRTTVTIIDQTTSQVLDTLALDGTTDEPIDFATAHAKKDGYLASGYALVSDDTVFNGYFTTDTPTYTIVLAHHHEQVTQSVTRQVYYVMNDGSKAPAPVSQTVEMVGDRDDVTGDIVWQAVSLAGVVSPIMSNYTADQLVVGGVILTTPVATNVVVHYQAVPVTEPTPEPVPMPKPAPSLAPVETPAQKPTLKPVASVVNDEQVAQHLLLPDTGVEQEYLVTVAELLLIAIAAGLAVAGTMRRQDK